MKRNLLNFFRGKLSTAVFNESFGVPLDVLQWGTIETNKVDPGKGVLVKMIASVVNPSDINMIEGTYGKLPELPEICGNEGVGIVQEVDEGVSNFEPGDFVIPVESGIGGVWCTENVFDEDLLYKVPYSIPDEIPLELAASIRINPLSAYRMLHDFCDLQEGDAVIMNGANSQVGRAALQIAKNYMNCVTIGVLRDRPNWEEYCEGITCADVLVKEEEFSDFLGSDFLKENRPMLAMNCVGGESASNLCKSLDHSGTMVTYGGMGRKPITIGTGPFIFKDLRLRGFWLDKTSVEEKIDGLDKMMELVKDGLYTGGGYSKRIFDEENFFEAMDHYFNREFNDGKLMFVHDEEYL